MKKENKKLLVTTAIDYVNSFPHAGHAFEKIQADVIARYSRLLGRDVFFLTGSDENSLKNVRAAENEGISVKDFVDRNAAKFQELKGLLNLSFDDFVRTTEERHIQGVQKLWQECAKKGDLYLGEYEGLYCVGCEAYFTPDELENGCCPEHKTEPEKIKEKNWFFRLSKYQQQIKEVIENEAIKIVPETRRNEILSFLKQDLRDICVSRSNERAKNWGISVPGDDTQKVWCWFDALGNYITALGYGSDEKKFNDYWENGEVLHVIGKGISRFHAVYWLGILLSAGVKIPDKIFIHGYITVDGQKMSKSIGNVINPFELVEKYAQKIGNKEAAVDAVRYFLSREISPTEDGDFTYEKFEGRYNSDLASGIGNLLARVVTLASKISDSVILSQQAKNPGVRPFARPRRPQGDTAVSFSNTNFQTKTEEIKKQYKQFLDEFKFNEALGAVWGLIGFCDKYVNDNKPWEGGEDAPQVISDLLLVLQEIAELLKPFMPQTAEKILEQVKTGKSQPLFPRI